MSLKSTGNYNAGGLSESTTMLQQDRSLNKILLWHLSFKTPDKISHCDQGPLAEGGLCSPLLRFWNVISHSLQEHCNPVHKALTFLLEISIRTKD